jgi:hypothetical protein
MRRAERALEHVTKDAEQEAAKMKDRVATTGEGTKEDEQPSPPKDTGDTASKGAA